MGQPLRDFVGYFENVQLSEGVRDSNGYAPLIMRGLFQARDRKNENGRIYPGSLWEKNFSNPRLQETLHERGMVGEVDHPADWKISLKRASHIITALEMQQNGDIIGTVEVLNTPDGKILRTLAEAKIRMGISSRGNGSTSRNSEGAEVVGDDFILETFDFVADPSTLGAYPKVVSECLRIAEEAGYVGRIRAGSPDITLPAHTSLDTPRFVNPTPSPSGGTMSRLREYREAEREALDLIRTDVKGASAPLLDALRQRVEESIVRVGEIVRDDPSLAQVSGTLVGALRTRQGRLLGLQETSDKSSKSSSSKTSDSDIPDFLKGKIKKKGEAFGQSSDEPDEDDDKDDDKDSSGEREAIERMFEAETQGPDVLSAPVSGDPPADPPPAPTEDNIDTAVDKVLAHVPEGHRRGATTVNQLMDRYFREDGGMIPYTADTTDTADPKPDGDAPMAAPDPAPDLVSRTAEQIKKEARWLAANPGMLEAFVRRAYKTENVRRILGSRLKTSSVRFTRTAEALVGRYQGIKGRRHAEQKRLNFALMAIGELRVRHETLKNKVVINENLRGLPREDRFRWIERLSKAPTRRDLIAGIRRVQAEYKKRAAGGTVTEGRNAPATPPALPVTPPAPIYEVNTSKAPRVVPIRLAENRSQTTPSAASSGIALFRSIKRAKHLN
jgi:hypothetical protein